MDQARPGGDDNWEYEEAQSEIAQGVATDAGTREGELGRSEHMGTLLSGYHLRVSLLKVDSNDLPSDQQSRFIHVSRTALEQRGLVCMYNYRESHRRNTYNASYRHSTRLETSDIGGAKKRGSRVPAEISHSEARLTALPVPAAEEAPSLAFSHRGISTAQGIKTLLQLHIYCTAAHLYDFDIMSQPDFLVLPAEISANVLSFLEAEDVIAFGRTCPRAGTFVAPDNPGNNSLWRRIFLNTYDSPVYAWELLTPSARKATDEKNWNWYHQLCRRKTVERLICDDIVLPLLDDYTEVIEILLSMVDTAKPRPNPSDLARGVRPQIDDRRSLNLDILARLSDRGRTNIERIIHARQMEALTQIPSRSQGGGPVTRSATVTIEQPDNASRLHLLYGLTEMEQKAPRLRGAGRRLVYDWSLTGPQTDYGPFRLDGSGRVNWQLLEGVCSTISRNFGRCADGRIVMPQGFHFSIPYRSLPDPLVPDDWAGVEGAWLGTYAFLDYADLFHFNLGHRPGQRPNLDDEPEACGDLMRLELKLNPKLCSDPKLRTSVPICDDLPMLYFSGESKGHDGAYRPTIGVRGTVSLVPGGREVRWRYLINYGGGDQWQLEGVQPGGMRSGGVYGLWSHCDHTENGPVGPFCYFPNELCKTTELATIPQAS